MVRVACLQALYILMGDEALPLVHEAFEKLDHEDIKFYAVEVIGKIESDRSMQFLNNHLNQDLPLRVKEIIAYTLAKKADPSSKSAFVTLLETEKQSPRLIERAIEYFINSENKEMAEKIEPYRNHHYTPLRVKALFYLLLCGDKMAKNEILSHIPELDSDFIIHYKNQRFRGTEGLVELLDRHF